VGKQQQKQARKN